MQCFIQLEEMRKRSEEIDVELVPAKSLMKRSILADSQNLAYPSLLTSRYVKAPPDITSIFNFLHKVFLKIYFSGTFW